MPARQTKSARKPARSSAQPVQQDDLLDIDQAVAMIKTSRPTFYRWLRIGQIKGLRVGRQWRFRRQELERFMTGQHPQVDLPPAAAELTNLLAGKLCELGIEEMKSDEFATVSSPAVSRLIMLLLRLGTALNASDLHMEPYPDQSAGGATRIRIRYRIGGTLHPIATTDQKVLMAVIDALKSAAQCDVQQREVPQDCMLLVETSKPPKEISSVQVRICFMPTHIGEAVTMRYLLRNAMKFELSSIPYHPSDMQRLRTALKLPWGIILITGPMGSGKTTVLYCALNERTTEAVKVMTIEDPVEYALPGVTQVQINPKTGMTFPRAIRAAFRSDPDVLMVGEIRDAEMLNLCCQAALTGHLVLTTLHTDTAVGAIRRVLDIGLEPFLASDAIKLIVAQRLVRILCPDCSKPFTPSDTMLQEAQVRARSGGIAWEQLPGNYRKPVGCTRCGNTGYRGRTPIVESLTMSPEVMSAIRRRASDADMQTLAVAQGMTTMAADGIRRAAEGKLSLEEVLYTAPRE